MKSRHDELFGLTVSFRCLANKKAWAILFFWNMLPKLFSIKQSNGGWRRLIFLFKSPFPQINQKDHHCSSRSLYLCFELNSTLSAKQAMGDFGQRRIQTLKSGVEDKSFQHHHHHPLAKVLVKSQGGSAVTSLLPRRTHSRAGRHVLGHTKGLQSIFSYKGNSITKIKQAMHRGGTKETVYYKWASTMSQICEELCLLQWAFLSQKDTLTSEMFSYISSCRKRSINTYQERVCGRQWVRKRASAGINREGKLCRRFSLWGLWVSKPS